MTTTQSTLRLDIVSAEKQIFTGEVSMVFVTGEMGELGLAPGHSQLLTSLRPGFVRAMLPKVATSSYFVKRRAASARIP